MYCCLAMIGKGYLSVQKASEVELTECASVFGALSDPTRLRILALLRERDRCVNELVSQFKLSQPTISKHLAVLKCCGLVDDTRDGRRVCYSLNWRSFQCCQEYVGNMDHSSADRTAHD